MDPDSTNERAPQTSGARDAGVLGAGLSIEGLLRGDADLRLEGTLRGEVALDGALTLGPDAQLLGPARARRLEVSGEIHGNLRAAHVILRAGAWVTGDVHAESISIDDGATLEGLVEMDLAPGRPTSGGSR